MRSSAGLAALLVVACRTHTVADCRPPCDEIDVEAFAGCVANGTAECLAGHRQCCATMAVNCIGMLDDQTVVTTATDCGFVTEDTCWPPCTADDVTAFDDCVLSGSAGCGSGDDVCCALEADCLGTLGDLLVTADGCCSGPGDCPLGQTCSTSTWMCVTSMGVCGDGATDAGEGCDDGNTVTETCAYGETSCTVCASDCTNQAGATSYCGDDVVDDVHGENCEPPDTTSCDPNCSAYPAHCSDRVLSPRNGETDVDCGGPCRGCAPNERCNTAADCRAVAPECNGVVDCDTSKFLCTETYDCSDGDDCTEDLCTPGTGCSNPALDLDRDGFLAESVIPATGGMAISCGGDDCDDFVDTVNPGVMFDLGCSTTDVGFGVDNDCDTFFDEDC